MRGRKAFDPGFGASAGLSEVAQWPRLDRPEPRLQAAWHDNTVCGARSRHRKDHCDAFKTAPPRRVSRLHKPRHRGFSCPSGASFTSPKQLQGHIDAYINAYNDKAEPFVWTKKKVRQRRFKGRRITQL